MIDGVKLKLSGKEYEVPSLSWGFIKKNVKLIDKLQKLGSNVQLSEELVNDFTKVIHAAFKRNYPDITVEELDEIIDMRNMSDVFKAIMGQSGFVENGEAPGEVPPVK